MTVKKVGIVIYGEGKTEASRYPTLHILKKEV